MNKKELALLEKAYEIEIDSALTGNLGMLQTKSRLAELLVAEGYLQHHTIQFGGQLPIVSHGYLLTHAGRIAYCLTCDDGGGVA
jgi:hypothetical protein